jgi:hypothetical protein
MKKPPLIQLAVTFVLFSAGALASQAYMPELKKQLKDTYSTLTSEPEPAIELEKSQLINLEILAPNPTPPIPERVITREYDNHLYAGENNGFGLIEDENHFKKLVEEQKLVIVTKGAGYETMALTHSHPYITLHSKIVLEELGQAYQKLSSVGSFFTLSSITRTPQQQKSLRKRNKNATSGISSHSYGVSFDISYIRFNGKKGSNRAAQKNLEKILNNFQDSNKIFFLKERRQSCYHITVK